VGKRIKFNVHDIFMDSQNTVSDRNLFVTSPLFGIFAALYNRSGGKVKVGKIDTKTFYPSSGHVLFVERVYVVNKWGMQVCNIYNTSVDYDCIMFNTYHQPINHENFISVALQTTNPKYLQSKLSPSSSHDAANRFDSALHRADHFFNDYVRDTIHKTVDERFGAHSERSGFKVRGNLPDSAVLFLAKHFMGEVSSAEMRPKDRSVFDLVYKKYCETLEKFKVALKDTYDMVSTEKWLYVTDVNGGVVLGAIRPEPMCAALDTLTEGDTTIPDSVAFNYIQETLPIKWYLNYESIPEDIRQQLEFSMVMLRTHAGSRSEIFNDFGDYVFPELGSRYYSPGGGVSKFYFLTK